MAAMSKHLGESTGEILLRKLLVRCAPLFLSKAMSPNAVDEEDTSHNNNPVSPSKSAC